MQMKQRFSLLRTCLLLPLIVVAVAPVAMAAPDPPPSYVAGREPEAPALDAKTRKFTEARVNEARGNVESTLGQVRERSQETWDKLEKVFEDRVQRALVKLGVPGRNDLNALTERVERLTAELRKANGGAAPKKAVKAPAGKPSKAPAKKAAKRAKPAAKPAE